MFWSALAFIVILAMLFAGLVVLDTLPMVRTLKRLESTYRFASVERLGRTVKHVTADGGNHWYVCLDMGDDSVYIVGDADEFDLAHLKLMRREPPTGPWQERLLHMERTFRVRDANGTTAMLTVDGGKRWYDIRTGPDGTRIIGAANPARVATLDRWERLVRFAGEHCLDGSAELTAEDVAVLEGVSAMKPEAK